MYTKVLATLIYRRVYDNDLTKFFLKNHVSVLVPIYVYTSLCRVNCDDDFLIPSVCFLLTLGKTAHALNLEAMTCQKLLATSPKVY